MFVRNKKKVVDTLTNECTQKKLAKSSNFFVWVYLSELVYLSVQLQAHVYEPHGAAVFSGHSGDFMKKVLLATWALGIDR